MATVVLCDGCGSKDLLYRVDIHVQLRQYESGMDPATPEKNIQEQAEVCNRCASKLLIKDIVRHMVELQDHSTKYYDLLWKNG